MKKYFLPGLILLLALLFIYNKKKHTVCQPEQVIKKEKIAYDQNLHKKFQQARHAAALLQGKRNPNLPNVA